MQQRRVSRYSARLDRIEGRTFVGDWLDSQSVVIDLGAAGGTVARGIVSAFGCKVTALEPDPRRLGHLANVPGVVVEPAALDSTLGTGRLLFNRSGDSSLMSKIVEAAARVLRTRRSTSSGTGSATTGMSPPSVGPQPSRWS